MYAGNGCVNDFSRGFATQSLAHLLANQLGITEKAIKERIAFIMSGGTEGILSPHIIVFSVNKAGPARAIPRAQHLNGVSRNGRNINQGKRLAVGVAFTEEFRPEQQGRLAQVQISSLDICSCKIARSVILDY